MALSLFGTRPVDDPFESTLFDPFSFPSYTSWTSPNTRFGDLSRTDLSSVTRTQVDWKETSDEHIIKANLPGLTRDDVKVQVEDGRILQISGEMKAEAESATDRWHRVERPQRGTFMRRFRLPENAKLEEVKANMENGVLTVRVPKAMPSGGRTDITPIEISS
ncbi:hypothetical protein KP509_36G025900 [Ceratopteris richardii]|uniref:SHSP domain-containing protein n=1 Tax=Ceratopteris richardii TaxID=49495 RepID=A0A8T2QAH2_CERRI|nr:hypothetical protein KP509_36G025900 [Ceratopteris richardii]